MAKSGSKLCPHVSFTTLWSEGAVYVYVRLWSVNIFDIIKSRTLVQRYIQLSAFLDFQIENLESASHIVGSSEVVYVIRAFTGNTNSTSDPMRVRRNRRIADSRLCRPPGGRTKFPSLTLTNHSSSGDLLLFYDKPSQSKDK